jgi:hypothetical protein
MPIVDDLNGGVKCEEFSEVIRIDEGSAIPPTQWAGFCAMLRRVADCTGAVPTDFSYSELSLEKLITLLSGNTP